jgi:hypothetical protein
MVDGTASLRQHLDELLKWLATRCEVPPIDGCVVLDTSHRRVRYQAGLSGGSWVVSADALVSLEAYDHTFAALLRRGYAWINLSAYGIYEQKLVLGIELPRDSAGAPFGSTSVNYSGPAQDVKTGVPNWALRIDVCD